MPWGWMGARGGGVWGFPGVGPRARRQYRYSSPKACQWGPPLSRSPLPPNTTHNPNLVRLPHLCANPGPLPEPLILGYDGAGVVEAVGSAVTLFKVTCQPEQCGPESQTHTHTHTHSRPHPLVIH
jgi:hypothetical protein